MKMKERKGQIIVKCMPHDRQMIDTFNKTVNVDKQLYVFIGKFSMQTWKVDFSLLIEMFVQISTSFICILFIRLFEYILRALSQLLRMWLDQKHSLFISMCRSTCV